VVGEERLVTDLIGAVERGEIVAHYQPQVDLTTNRIVAAEALARWRHPELGVIGPAVFIPIAEENALIHSLGRFMIEQVLETVASWNSRGIDLEVSVNVSANQLTTLEFFDLLDADLARLELTPGAVTIEITESYPILDTPSIALRLDALRSRGLGISIDDYGVGYSSLQQLERMPATELKIDQSLVQDESVQSLALMTAVVELAHWRGLRVVAEGVETEAQLDRMRELSCDRAQGYLLGRPMPQNELERLVG
jgi:EAL domain-containing protein (putative c-di-GMP-specific phosphodiesterase class I)